MCHKTKHYSLSNPVWFNFSQTKRILTVLDLCFSLIYQTLLYPSVPNPSTWPILMDLEYLPVFSFLSLLYWVKLTQMFPTVTNASLCEWEARWAHHLCVAIVSCASPEKAGCARKPSHLRRGLLKDQSCTVLVVISGISSCWMCYGSSWRYTSVPGGWWQSWLSFGTSSLCFLISKYQKT